MFTVRVLSLSRFVLRIKFCFALWLQLQDMWFTLCTRAFKASDASTYPEYAAVATGKVDEFLELEEVRALFRLFSNQL